MRLLEDDALGGGGSRGSGRVSFSKLRLVWRGKNHYAVRRAGKGDRRGRHAGRHSDRRHGIGLLLPARGVMNPGLVVKLRPSGPWRIGPDSGARNRVDVIYHSDSLYSAVTAAMARLGWLEEWLDATARDRHAGSLVQFLLSLSRRDGLRGSAAHRLAAGIAHRRRRRGCAGRARGSFR